MQNFEITKKREVKEEDKWIFDNPSRGTRFEVPDFEIPDLTVPEGRVGVEKTVTLKVESSTIPDFEVVLKITRYKEPSKVLVAVDLQGTSESKNVFNFRDALFFKSAQSGEEPHKYWSSGHREVERAFIGKGVAEFFLGFREKLAKKLSEKDSALQADWMEVTTDIAAVGNLVIDQNWLEAHGLSQYSKKHGVNLGYVPDPKDESRVENLLNSKTTRLGEIDRKGEEAIKFIKLLNQ